MQKIHPLKTMLCGLTLSLALSSCSPERRTALRLTALSFRSQANDAIESVKTIYQLGAIPRSIAESRKIILRRLLTDTNLDLGTPEALSEFVSRSLNIPSPHPNPVNVELDQLQQEYIIASETFNNIDQAGLLGTESDEVARALEPARRLTVKMLELAKLIAQDPPTPKDPDRVLIVYEFDKLRNQYRAASSDAERADIMTQAEALLDQWLTTNVQEQVMVCQATAKLLATAETGAKLSSLIENYSHLTFNEIATKITTALGLASSFGANVEDIQTRIDTIQKQINDDPVLNKLLEQPPETSTQPSVQTLQCSS